MTQARHKERASTGDSKRISSQSDGLEASSPLIFSEKQFREMLCRERKRSERSRKHLVLMLIDTEDHPESKIDKLHLRQVAEAVSELIRETDLTGWFEQGVVIGAIFTELGNTEVNAAFTTIQAKITAGLKKTFKTAQLEKLRISFYAFPEDWAGDGRRHVVAARLYPDLFEVQSQKKVFLVTKRAMDIVGSTIALIACLPIYMLLALIVKLTSTGPVFFRQERIGQFGVPFIFMKFRSMYISTDAKIHEEFVREFIAGKSSTTPAAGDEKVVYKITNDPRVTWIGRLMRRTSLDELPQFWNVLKGEMSLVGPRPPIPYEIDAYDIWHRRRLLEAKPGITGLWQVHGRSRTTFDEMVRLDLQYSRSWSPLLDLKILLQTPRAVLTGDGAY